MMEFYCLAVAPVISTPPMNQTAVAGNNVTFMCSAEGLPRPTITWFAVINSSSSIELTTDVVVFSIDNSDAGERGVMSILTITDVQPNMARTYICNATNDVSATQSLAVLTVHCK